MLIEFHHHGTGAVQQPFQTRLLANLWYLSKSSHTKQPELKYKCNDLLVATNNRDLRINLFNFAGK